MPEIICKSIVVADKEDAGRDNPPSIIIYSVNISLNASLLPYANTVLSVDEQRRVDSYHHEHDRSRFIISRIALRMLLAKQIGIKAADITFDEGESKKPYVSNAISTPVCYNVSHSGDLIVIAIASTPVGIDIEHIKQGFDIAGIVTSCFSVVEQKYVAQSGILSFYTLWTRKEALLKATGNGIDDEMVNIPCLDGVHKVPAGIIGSAESWVVQSISMGDYLCSVASSPGVEEIHCAAFIGE